MSVQRDLGEAWGDRIGVEAEAYFELGERSLAFDVMRGRGRRSDVEVVLPGAAVTTWRDGRCVHFKAYARREDALADVGLSEASLRKRRSD